MAAPPKKFSFPGFFRRKSLLRGAIFFLVLGVPAAGWVLGHWFNRLPFADHDEDEQQSVLKRDQWFNRGRKSPDQNPAAWHRLQALLQAKNIPLARPASGPAPSGLRPKAGPLAPPPSGSCDWSEQGPAPLNDSNYGNVSGRLTNLVLDLAHDPTGNTL